MHITQTLKLAGPLVALLLPPLKHAYAGLPAAPNCSALEVERALKTPIYLSNLPMERVVRKVGIEAVQPAGSEQIPSLSIGAKPYELAQGIAADAPRLWRGLETSAAVQMKNLAEKNGWQEAFVEAWPTRDEYGIFTWTMSRFKTNAESEWQWLRSDRHAYEHKVTDSIPPPILPEALPLRSRETAKSLFAEMEELGGLYDKPGIGNTVWVRQQAEQSITIAWPSPEARRELAAAFLANPIEWKNAWDDGHFAVVIGYDSDHLYFMDPSLTGNYAFIPISEFLDRWHDVDGTERLHNFGMIVTKGAPTFSHDVAIHME
jgi:hypothetical protein